MNYACDWFNIVRACVCVNVSVNFVRKTNRTPKRFLSDVIRVTQYVMCIACARLLANGPYHSNQLGITICRASQVSSNNDLNIRKKRLWFRYFPLFFGDCLVHQQGKQTQFYLTNVCVRLFSV